MQTVFRRFMWQRRRGAIDPFTALAVASMVLTAAGTARQIHRGAESALTADELRYGSNQVADGLKRILAVKYQRMHQNGQLNRAEYETLQHRLESDATRRALQAVAEELADKQTKLSEDAFWDLQRDTAISVALSGVGEAAGALGSRTQTGAEVLQNLRNYAQNVETANRVAAGADALSTTLTVNGLVNDVSRNPYIVNANDFQNALNQVQQHVQPGGQPGSQPGVQPGGDAALLVRVRVRAFFDKWCVDKQVDRYRDDPNHENWVRGHRSSFQEQCRTDFERYIRQLEQDGWSVPGRSLHDYAWEMLTTYDGYRETFGRDYTGVYMVTAAAMTGEGQTRYELRFDDHRDGTATLTLVLPANVDLQDLPKVGLPAKRELDFPLQAKIDRRTSEESAFYTQGREIHAVVSAFAKVCTSITVALTSLFGGDAQQDAALIDQSRGENCLLVFQPVSQDSRDLTVRFSGVLVTPETSSGRMERKKFDVTNRAVRVR